MSRARSRSLTRAKTVDFRNAATRLKVLILGGYGTFGGRLAQLLADEARLTLIIAGRSIARRPPRVSAPTAGERSERRRHSIVPRRTLARPGSSRGAQFDRDGDVERQLRELAPDVVVDATGPFQAYGDDPYRVVRAALALGIHYLDLADGSDFVEGIAQFDAAARARGVFVLAGVASFPVLTAAVVRRLAPDMARVERSPAGSRHRPTPMSAST